MSPASMILGIAVALKCYKVHVSSNSLRNTPMSVGLT
jgi:hypothetical protein